MKLRSNSGVAALLSLSIILPIPPNNSVIIALIRCSLYGGGTKSNTYFSPVLLASIFPFSSLILIQFKPLLPVYKIMTLTELLSFLPFNSNLIPSHFPEFCLVNLYLSSKKRNDSQGFLWRSVVRTQYFLCCGPSSVLVGELRSCKPCG